MDDTTSYPTDSDKSTARRLRNDERVASRGYVFSTGEVISKSIGEVVAQVLRPLKARVAALENELSQQKYRGTWQRADDYLKNNFVTSDGSLWACLRDNHGTKPGDDATAWQLCVKNGRDAR